MNVVKVAIFINILWSWERSEEIRGEEMWLQLIVCEVLRQNFKIRENIGLSYSDHWLDLLIGFAEWLCCPVVTILVVVWNIWLVANNWSCQRISFWTGYLWHLLDMSLDVILDIS